MARLKQIFLECFYANRIKLQVGMLQVAGYYPFHLQGIITDLGCLVQELVSGTKLQIGRLQVASYFRERLNRLLNLARASSLVTDHNRMKFSKGIHTSLEARARGIYPARFARSDIEFRVATLCFPLPELATSTQHLVTDFIQPKPIKPCSEAF